MSKATAYLRTTHRATRDIYSQEENPETGKKEITCYKGEFDHDGAVFNGPYFRDELEDWVTRTRDEHGEHKSRWDIVEERDLPEGFKPTNILR